MENSDGLTGVCLAGEMGDSFREMLEEGAELVKIITAKNHYEVMTEYYRFMEWGEYITDESWDHEEYSLEWYEIQKSSMQKEIIKNLITANICSAFGLGLH